MSEQNQSEATLRELAIRLLSPRYPGTEHMQVTDLLPGQLPPNLPIDLAIPPDARLIGSVVRGQDSTTVFDTSLTAEQVLAFYRERMSVLDWAEQEREGFQLLQQSGGFVHAMSHQMAHTLFFASSRGPSLRITISPGPNATIEAQLTLEIRQSCGPLRRKLHSEMDLIPLLLAPDGAAQRSLGGGGGGSEWRANAELTSDLDLAAVTDHYTAQLQGAGWRASSQGEGDRVRYEPKRYFLDIHCQWAG
jgi:hypothetical protein